ncbi:MAG: 50S ribosomal protein L9 [Anaerolineae bacterium CG2_30_64_16]|nr:MAG: 50S ribosomal protein L9 [Anaerolineae bacterium CG2_30_64_16]
MQVLLLKDVEGLGRAGDIKHTSGGYAQNYLVPNKLAVVATDGAIKQARSIQDAAKRRSERKLTEAKTLAGRIEGQTLTLQMRAGEGDRLYGSVTNADIAEKLSRAAGAEIDRRLVDIEHPIKTLGRHAVIVKLGSGVSVQVAVQVERAAEEA